MTTPTKTWRRGGSRLGRDRNPLCRRSDLIEAWLLPAVVVAFLVLGPLVAGAAGLRVRADIAAARHAQLSWHRTSAVLLAAAPGPLFSDNGANSWGVWTSARWSADGQQRVGAVALAALAVLLACLALIGRRVLDWRRLAGWETAWQSVGPQWTCRG